MTNAAVTDDMLEYRSLRGSYISVDEKNGLFGESDSRSEVSEAMNDGNERDNLLLPMTYASIRQSVERRFSGKRSTHDYMAKLNVLKARWGVSADAGALAGRSSGGSGGGGGGENERGDGAREINRDGGRGRVGSVASAATDSIESGSVISDLTRPSAATAPTLLYSTLMSKKNIKTNNLSTNTVSSIKLSSSTITSASAFVYLVSGSHTSPSIGLRISVGQSIEWRALSMRELTPLLSSLSSTSISRIGGSTYVEALKKIVSKDEEIEDVSTYSIEITKRKSSSSSSSSTMDVNEWSSTLELTVCSHTLKDRAISTSLNGVGIGGIGVMSVLDSSRGGLGCSICKWHNGLVFEERGLYDWNWTIYPYVRGTIVVLDTPTLPLRQTPSTFPISIPPPPPLPTFLVPSHTSLPLSVDVEKSRVDKKQGVDDDDEDDDDDGKSSLPTTITSQSVMMSPSPSESASISSKKRRRNRKKKKKTSSTDAAADDEATASTTDVVVVAADDDVAVSTPIDSINTYKSDIKNKDVINTTTQLDHVKEEIATKKKGDENILLSVQQEVEEEEEEYRGPRTEWCIVRPGSDPNKFDAWGKFMYACINRTVKIGDVYSSDRRPRQMSSSSSSKNKF
jgi:hypothetical protein